MPDTALRSGLLRIVSTLATITTVGGYTFDLSGTNQVQIGRYMQPPSASPSAPATGSPWVMVAFREELDWGRRGRDTSRRATYDVIGWVRGTSLPGGSDSIAHRAEAATALYDDISSALLADTRMGGLAEDLVVRGAAFNDDVVPGTSGRYGIVVALVTVTFRWRED
jgi:hypothetical protein